MEPIDIVIQMNSTNKQYKEKKILVCNKCFRASCWYGKFICDEAIDAGTVKKTRKELAEKNLENPHYWEDEKLAFTFSDPDTEIFLYSNLEKCKPNYIFQNGKHTNFKDTDK